ncbi:MAG: hypothetical protein AB7S38_41445 [Vulcanimicrobiota bacterium]
MLDLSNFLESLGSQGTHHSSGEFTLAAENRLRPLQQAVAAHPGLFALKLVQGLISAGASEVRCAVGRSSLKLSAPGCRFHGHSLLQAFSVPPSHEAEPIHHLLMGVLGGLAQDVASVSWRLAGGELVSFARDGTVIAVDSDEADRTDLQFKFLTRWSVGGLQRSLKLRSALHDTLSRRCCFSGIPVYLGSRRLRPPELCSRYAASGGKVRTEMETTMFRSNVTMVVNSHSYQYWARAEVYGERPAPSHEPQPVWGPVQMEGLEDLYGPDWEGEWYHALLALHYERTAEGLQPVSQIRAGHQLVSSHYLLADPSAQAGILVLVHHGVVVFNGLRPVGSSRGISFAAADGLDFDASSLGVVENEKFTRLREQLEEEMAAVLAAFRKRRSLAAHGLRHPPGRLD